MLILISNSQRLETKSPCKSANYFEGIQCRIPKTAYGLQLAFCFAVPALGLVCTSIRGKMYTRNLEIFGNNLRTRSVKVQGFNGRVSFTFTSIIYSRKANNRRVMEFVTQESMLLSHFCWISRWSCFVRVFILGATNINYMLFLFNIISKSRSFVLFNIQIKENLSKCLAGEGNFLV